MARKPGYPPDKPEEAYGRHAAGKTQVTLHPFIPVGAHLNPQEAWFDRSGLPAGGGEVMSADDNVPLRARVLMV
jgi:hypothetical protein